MPSVAHWENERAFLADRAVSPHLSEVSKQTVSTITEKAMEGMAEWQSRPLDRVYLVVFIDAINVKIWDNTWSRLSASRRDSQASRSLVEFAWLMAARRRSPAPRHARTRRSARRRLALRPTRAHRLDHQCQPAHAPSSR